MHSSLGYECYKMQGTPLGDPGIIHAVSGALSGVDGLMLACVLCVAQLVSVLLMANAADQACGRKNGPRRPEALH